MSRVKGGVTGVYGERKRSDWGGGSDSVTVVWFVEGCGEVVRNFVLLEKREGRREGEKKERRRILLSLGVRITKQR